MPDPSSPSKDPKQRIVRVFVSSTFRDMQDERDELVLTTFPELRKRCRERQVEFVEVDLRWGITEEQSQRGEVLPICLAEIARCRPYFICLLGERYGWVPDMIDPELIQTQEWLEEHREKSVTELEILHGVLRNPSMAGRSYFYFRDPVFLDQVPEEQKSNFFSEDPKSLEKLEHLKQRIRASGLPLRDKYPSPTAVGQLILDDLWEAIDMEFPEEDIPDPLDREAMEHEAFAQSRAKVYIGREEYFEKLDDHISSDSPPLVLVGESGVGKSALIACWADRYRKSHAEDLMILHFIGSSQGSTDYRSIIRRIMGEIKRRYGLDDEIPSAPDKLREALPFLLASASAKGKMILILEALNQLEDIDIARHLGWLPSHFPPNVRVIVSSLPGSPMEALEKRRWPQYEIHGLRPDERRALIEEYLGLYRKTLSPSQLELIASSPQTSNPLFLRALLEELRIFGIYEDLDKRIRHYLLAQTVPDLYEKILERLEEDYEKEHEDLVGDSLSLIWASRRGLYESELLELLGDSDQPISRMIWSPLYLAIAESLVNRSGLLNFFHDHLRQAAEHRYLSSESSRKKRHVQLADYYSRREIDDRKVDELPWQLEKAQLWERLKDCVTDIGMFLELMVGTKQYELIGYWMKLEALSYDPVKLYDSTIAEYEKSEPEPHGLANAIRTAAYFFRLTAKYSGADPLFRRALEIREKIYGPTHPDTASSLIDLASLRFDVGDYAGAAPIFRRVFETLEQSEVADQNQVAFVLINLGETLRMMGDFSGAEDCFRKSLTIREQLLGPEHLKAADSLNYLGLALENKGDYVEAEAVHRKSLGINERILGPVDPDTARSYNNLAGILMANSDWTGAEKHYKSALEIFERMFGPTHPNTLAVINNMVCLHYRMGHYADAEALCRRVLASCKQVLGDNHLYTTYALNNLANVMRAQGEYDAAEPLYREALEIREKTLGPHHPDMATTLKDWAILLEAKGDYDAAEHLMRRALDIRRLVLGSDHPDTATCLNNLASILIEKGGLTDAESMYREALQIHEKTRGPDHPDTATCLNNRARLLNERGDYNEAETLLHRALKIRERVLEPGHPETIMSYNNLATLLANKGDYAGAEPLYKTVLEINECHRGPFHLDTATSLTNLALLLHVKHDNDGADPLYRRALRIIEQILGPEHPDAITARFNLAQFLRDIGDHETARNHYEMITEIQERLPQRKPELDRMAAIAHNELALHTCEPAKDWEKAEYHYNKAIELVNGVPDPAEAAIMELNLLGMRRSSNKPVDLNRARELIRVLEDAGDPRAEKKRALLEELSRP